MVVVPADTPFTVPPVTVATPGTVLVQTPDGVVLDNTVDCPTHTEPVPVRAAGAAVMVIICADEVKSGVQVPVVDHVT